MIVAVGKDVGLDDHRLADDALGGEASGVDLRHDVLNGDALLPVFGLGQRFFLRRHGTPGLPGSGLKSWR